VIRHGTIDRALAEMQLKLYYPGSRVAKKGRVTFSLRWLRDTPQYIPGQRNCLLLFDMGDSRA
jgi:hypothetical protein